MFEPYVVYTENGKGKMEIRHLAGSIVEVVYSGECNGKLIQSVLLIAPGILQMIPALCCLIDMSQVTRMDNDSAPVGKAVFQFIKEKEKAREVRLVALVVNNPIVRLLVNTSAMLARFPLKVFDSRDKAVLFLRQIDT